MADNNDGSATTPAEYGQVGCHRAKQNARPEPLEAIIPRRWKRTLPFWHDVCRP